LRVQLKTLLYNCYVRNWTLLILIDFWIDCIFPPIEDGRSGTFMIGNQSFPASLLDLPAVVESYKTYDDSFLVKTADIGQV
jgi:TATA-binding protein-associated factor Taf7